MNLRQTISRMFLGSMVFLLCAGALAATQEELDRLSAAGLLSEAEGTLSSESYSAAVPYLMAYLDRMKGEKDERVLAMMQEVRLKLAKISVYLEDSPSAVVYLKQYVESLPLYKPREAFKLLAVNLYEVENYEECISAATYALTQPLPKALPKTEKKIDYDKLSRDDIDGITVRQLKRIEREVEAAGGDLSDDLSSDMPGPEPDYTVDELGLLNMTLAEACTALGKWGESLAPYQFVIKNAKEDDRKGYAILKEVNALIELKRFDEAGAFVVKLQRTSARYDIRVNMALMKAAQALSDHGELDSALMLYRMVLPREELVAYQKTKMNELRRDAGLPNVELTVVTNATGRLETLFGNSKSDLSLLGMDSRFSSNVELPPKPKALEKLEELVATLVALPPYEQMLLYRTGALYAKADRPWEAVAALDLVASRDADGELGQRAFAESLLVQVDPLKEYERVETRATQYLNIHNEGLAPRMVAYALAACYQKQKCWKEIKQLLPVIEQFVPSESKDIRQYECELYYMQAVADLMMFNYQGSLDGFGKVLKDFSGLQEQENATYWHAMSQLFLKRYKVALAEFNSYFAVYPDGSWLADATFQVGMCLFGMDELAAAQKQFSDVIKKYPDARVYPDARSLHGDILASEGKLDEAQQDYEAAIASKVCTPRQDTYAVFQMVSMFNLELDKRAQEIIDTVYAYLKRRGDTADVSKAAYWVGKTKLAQGLLGEAVDAYCDVILSYGGNIQQDGVDLIIEELSNVSRRLGVAEKQALEERLQRAAEHAENMTLKLRLQVLLAKINGTELVLGKELIASLTDLTKAPPPVLELICKASFEAGDYSRAAEILKIFETQYEDSDLIRNAYKLRAYDLYTSGDLDGAMKIVKEAQGLSGTEPDAVWAQLMKGRIELQKGVFDAALKTFGDVLNVREWRGEPYAEATFYLGKVEEQAGDFHKAFNWYQRVYVQYKGYAKGVWAADAYLASARCLEKLGRENDMRNTYRALLFDKYVNALPQADIARRALGPDEVKEINLLLVQGVQTNLTVGLDSKEVK